MKDMSQVVRALSLEVRAGRWKTEVNYRSREMGDGRWRRVEMRNHEDRARRRYVVYAWCIKLFHSFNIQGDSLAATTRILPLIAGLTHHMKPQHRIELALCDSHTATFDIT